MSPARLALVSTAPDPVLKPEIAPKHVVLPPAARHAFTAAAGRIGQLGRIFSGASASVSAASEIDRLCDDAIKELQRMKRFSR